MHTGRICLEDLDNEVNANKCIVTAELESAKAHRRVEIERVALNFVGRYIALLTPEYIKEKIISARTRGSSYVTLVDVKCGDAMQHGDMFLSEAFYNCIGKHEKSLKTHIESLVDTSTMIVVYNDEANLDKFVIYLCWGHFMRRPRFCLSSPCSTFLISILISFMICVVCGLYFK